MRSRTNVLTVLFCVVFLSIAENVLANDGEEDQDCGNKLGGLYIGQIPGLTTFAMSSIPLDTHHNKMLVIVDTTGDADPTARGLFPTAIGQSNPRGQLVRTSKKSYQGQLVRYRYDSNGEVVGTEIQGVGLQIVDCNAVQVSFVAQAFYFGYINPGMETLPAPDVNVDVSGFPPFIARGIIVDHQF